ncbi:MAG: FAD-dependent oxidoreductase [Pseudomonadota bacterium]
MQVIASGALLSPALASRSRAQGLGTDYDVVIVGAGVAGLAAAERLLSADDELKVLVLEARDRIGGRVYSVDREDMYRDAELGAQHLEHPDGVAWEVLTRFNLQPETLADGSITLFPGMSALVGALSDATAGKVQLNSEVTEIFWREGLVGINYQNRGLNSAVTARRMIMALPAGVLRDNPPAITPDLGPAKINALNSLGRKRYITASLLFSPDRAALTDGAESWIGRDGDTRLRAFRTGSQGELLLEAQFVGAKAELLQRESDALVLSLAVRAFKDVLPSTPMAADARWSEVVNWQREPFSYGGGTEAASTSTHLTLAESMGGTIFFAGEATADPDMVDTIHGAYASGARAAREVAVTLSLEIDEAEAEPLFELL